jgi:hypothetical protein
MTFGLPSTIRTRDLRLRSFKANTDMDAIDFHSQFLLPQAFCVATTLRQFQSRVLVLRLRIPIANY